MSLAPKHPTYVYQTLLLATSRELSHNKNTNNNSTTTTTTTSPYLPNSLFSASTSSTLLLHCDLFSYREQSLILPSMRSIKLSNESTYRNGMSYISSQIS